MYIAIGLLPITISRYSRVITDNVKSRFLFQALQKSFTFTLSFLLHAENVRNFFGIFIAICMRKPILTYDDPSHDSNGGTS